MKVIVRNNKIVGTCTDDYKGTDSDTPMQAPVGFTLDAMHKYTLQWDEVLEEFVLNPTLVPEAVTMRQARLALLAAGLYAQVDPAIASIVNTSQRAAAQIEWEYAQIIHRNSPLVSTMGALLSLTTNDLDNLFIAAGNI